VINKTHKPCQFLNSLIVLACVAILMQSMSAHSTIVGENDF
jgi:hypothetical protein